MSHRKFDNQLTIAFAIVCIIFYALAFISIAQHIIKSAAQETHEEQR